MRRFAWILLFGILFASAPSLAAADTEDSSGNDTITWSVRPANDEAADGRSWVEQTLEPGQSATERMAVQNFGDQDVTFTISAADGYFRDNGRFAMLETGEQSVDAGTWIDVQDEVTVAAGDSEIVEFTTTVPDNATPGDHAAGIAASVLSQGVDESGAAVGVESRIGFRVMTRVTGEMDPAAVIESVTMNYEMSWNPLSPGDAEVSFDVENAGNTRLMVTGSVDAGGASVSFPGADQIDQELLPGDRRAITVRVENVWPLFFVPAEVEITPAVVGDGEGTPVDAVRVDAGTWAIPIPQLIVLAGLVLIVGSIAWGRIRAKRRLAALLAAARDEGRREVAEGGGA